VTKTLIDLDVELLLQTQAIAGTTTKKDTVNHALREAVRAAAIRGFLQAVGGAPDQLVLADASALTHRAEPVVRARLLPLLVTDRLATCAAIEYELSALGALNGVPLRRLATEDADLLRAAQIQAELTLDRPQWTIAVPGTEMRVGVRDPSRTRDLAGPPGTQGQSQGQAGTPAAVLAYEAGLVALGARRERP
jgi:Arc/MetJ family transcription regulator